MLFLLLVFLVQHHLIQSAKVKTEVECTIVSIMRNEDIHRHTREKELEEDKIT